MTTAIDGPIDRAVSDGDISLVRNGFLTPPCIFKALARSEHITISISPIITHGYTSTDRTTTDSHITNTRVVVRISCLVCIKCLIGPIEILHVISKDIRSHTA